MTRPHRAQRGAERGAARRGRDALIARGLEQNGSRWATGRRPVPCSEGSETEAAESAGQIVW